MARKYLDRQNAGYRGINALLAVICPTNAAAAPINAVVAVLSTALTGNNNDMDFTARRKGTYGNGITIAYVDPAVETVTVTGKAIVVTLRSVSSVLSTAAQVKTAIEASGAANALVSVANKSSNNGTGVVTALTATALASGVDGTDGEPMAQVIYGGYLYINLVDGPVFPGATDTWYKQPSQLTIVP